MAKMQLFSNPRTRGLVCEWCVWQQWILGYNAMLHWLNSVFVYSRVAYRQCQSILPAVLQAAQGVGS